MCNKIILDFVRADSESAALDAVVSPSSLVPDVLRVLCWHSPVFQMLPLEEFLKCLVLLFLGMLIFPWKCPFGIRNSTPVHSTVCISASGLYKISA